MSRYYKDEHRYDDILHLPHHQSNERAHMSLHDRAAQFAPFAAVAGHDAAIAETARVTEEKIILDETMIEIINKTLYEIARCHTGKRHVTITYYRPDSRKKGGAYVTDVGVVNKINETENLVIMDSGITIKMEYIVGIEMLD